MMKICLGFYGFIRTTLTHENVISFINEFPMELGLINYIDYDLQFDKAFLDPLKTLLDSIGWSVEKISTLDSFFV